VLTLEDVNLARDRAMLKWPYLSKALLNLMPKESRAVVINGNPTLGVDSKYNLYFHPECKFTLRQMSSILVHEALHLVLMHSERSKAACVGGLLWNIAADLEINNNILEDGGELPDGAMITANFGFETGLPAEVYVYKLRDYYKQQEDRGQEQGDEQQEQNADSQEEDQEANDAESERDDSGRDADSERGQDDQAESQREQQDRDESDQESGAESQEKEGVDSDRSGGNAVGDKGTGTGGEHDPEQGHKRDSDEGTGAGEEEADNSGTPGQGSSTKRQGGSAGDNSQDRAAGSAEPEAGDSKQYSSGSDFGGSCADGIERPWEDEPDGISGLEARQLAEEVVQDAAKQYEQEEAKARRGYGKEPGGILRELALRKPRSYPKWQTALRASLGQAVAHKSGAQDYSYRKISRRGNQSRDVIFPGMIKYEPIVAVVCDISGSMDEKKLKIASQESAGAANFGKAYVLPCDTRVTGVIPVDNMFGTKHFAGGGGTNMMAGIKYAFEELPNKIGKRPDAVVVVTDGDTRWDYDYKPPKDVIVAVIIDSAYLESYGSVESMPCWRRVPAWAKKVAILEGGK
jgi:predicted metal-dependent peptidase